MCIFCYVDLPSHSEHVQISFQPHNVPPDTKNAVMTNPPQLFRPIFFLSESEIDLKTYNSSRKKFSQNVTRET